MKTSCEICDDIYAFVKASAIVEAVNGTLYANGRPKNSQQEDVTIEVTNNAFGDPQLAYVEVNIYVKDLLANEEYVIDKARVRELSRIAYDELKSHMGIDYYVVLDEQLFDKSKASNEHYIKNVLLYKHVDNN